MDFVHRSVFNIKTPKELKSGSSSFFFNSYSPIEAPLSNMAASVLVTCGLDSCISRSYRYNHLLLFTSYQFQQLRCLKGQVQVVKFLKMRRRMFKGESGVSVCCDAHRQ